MAELAEAMESNFTIVDFGVPDYYCPKDIDKVFDILQRNRACLNESRFKRVKNAGNFTIAFTR